MEDLSGRLLKNLTGIQNRIRAACLRAHRAPESVALIGVTKYARLDWVTELIKLGCRELAESRTQQLAERAELLSPDLHWHFIGPLQRNKVRRTIQYSHLIHSLDSEKLLKTIDRIAAESDLKPRVLIEVNLSGEANKKGFQKAELLQLWPSLCQVTHVQINGLMTMAPHVDDPEAARPVFRELSELRDTLQAISPEQTRLQELSMGMSGDFEVAIEEGATLVRVGSALFAGLEA
ncbi:YggS family pyridoxal phosphate-dependent enzyme [Gimesia algae]|uniref:Pyridoxal phosphate homeostasis protein n=1 Tax=Gimesia algae TaxID=2527971 RepID=A0A517VJL0_9PLAN|nr:YggS family pyridoxal phosphate-dependent enzyme [Gimesia algae]QDT93204.1 Pyridoxal phosphate homeostasis protein [Gimesia algae]